MKPGQGTTVCPDCGRRVGAIERDGSPVMHQVRKNDREPWLDNWCSGGIPEHVRYHNYPRTS